METYFFIKTVFVEFWSVGNQECWKGQRYPLKSLITYQINPNQKFPLPEIISVKVEGNEMNRDLSPEALWDEFGEDVTAHWNATRAEAATRKAERPPVHTNNPNGYKN